MRCVLFAAVLALMLPARGHAQISPGPLSRAHQSLDGTTRCTTCHGASADAMPRLCLSCHREVGWLMAQGRGLHAREAKVSGKSCGSCHPEHAGRDFELIAWSTGSAATFDHRDAGWSLEGKHATTACERCHRQEFRVGQAAVLSPRKGSAGWMGLETTCVSCHRHDDPHANSLGSDCQRCHNETAWTPAPKFDHATSRYPLTGKHVNVGCDKCHLAAQLDIAPGPDGTRRPRFRPLEFRECVSCHADPHRGQLGAKCTSCHVTRGFDVLDRREFNHATTRYPLLGKHRTVSCEACHGPAMANPRPAFDRCATCHADVHAGEAMLAGARADCASCHRVEGFAPATFTIAQHQATRFPLGGKHQGVRCAACHTTTAAAAGQVRIVHLRVASTACESCHADSHAGQVASMACAACHSDAGWTAIRYAPADHARAGFPLEGAHLPLVCTSCHGPARPGLPPLTGSPPTGHAGVRFKIGEVRCAACHADPHRATASAGRRDSTTDCERCHTSMSFRPAKIDVAAHGRFVFPLEGAHRAVPCGACHTGMDAASPLVGRGATLVAAPRSLAGVPLDAVKGTTCDACHQTPHGSQFAARIGHGQCDACHGSDTFIGSPRFNHDRDAAFALAGAHARVPCAGCHKTVTIAGVTQVIYRPIAHRCEDCHAGRAGRRGGGR